jgi:hypothetical protein
MLMFKSWKHKHEKYDKYGLYHSALNRDHGFDLIIFSCQNEKGISDLYEILVTSRCVEIERVVLIVLLTSTNFIKKNGKRISFE